VDVVGVKVRWARWVVEAVVVEAVDVLATVAA